MIILGCSYNCWTLALIVIVINRYVEICRVLSTYPKMRIFVPLRIADSWQRPPLQEKFRCHLLWGNSTSRSKRQISWKRLMRLSMYWKEYMAKKGGAWRVPINLTQRILFGVLVFFRHTIPFQQEYFAGYASDCWYDRRNNGFSKVF